MRDETAKNPAPAKKRPSCRRDRCEKREDRGSVGVGAGGACSRGAMAPLCRRAIELGEVYREISDLNLSCQ
jgi:hypothetical protein